MTLKSDKYIRDYKDKYEIEQLVTGMYHVIYLPTNEIICTCNSEIKATKILIGIALYQAIDMLFEDGETKVIVEAKTIK